jgi:putative heme iron utilization protein
VQEGWLIRDGVVLASAMRPNSGAAHAARSSQFTNGLGAIELRGPAFVMGVAIARLDQDDRIREVEPGSRLHLVGFGRRAYALAPAVASGVHVNDAVEFRVVE